MLVVHGGFLTVRDTSHTFFCSCHVVIL